MIPENYIEQWRIHAPWQAISMVEQDFVISRALVELFNQEVTPICAIYATKIPEIVL